jgi:hypothetical protein
MSIFNPTEYPPDNVSIINTASGLSVDMAGVDLVQTLVASTSNSDITISSNSQLVGDVFANNFTINSGVVLQTNGYNIYCSGDFTNNGSIATGYNEVYKNWSSSYGGSGGGTFVNGGAGGGAVSGYNTLVSGGSGSGSGSTPAQPTISNSLIQTWHQNGFVNYFSGASGGQQSSGGGGYGAYGIYIQATNITAGTINADGQSVNQGGGGGGGFVLLAYSGTLTSGTVTTSGGGGAGGTYPSGSGGAGNNMSYLYTTQPVSASGVSIPSTQGILATATITIPSQISVEIDVIGIVSSNVTQPATLYLYRGSDILTQIAAYTGFNDLYYIDNNLPSGNYSYTLQGVSTTSANIDLTKFVIKQIIGANA